MLKIFLYLIEGFIIGYFDFKFIKKDFNYYLISLFSIIFTLSHVIAEEYLVYDYLSIVITIAILYLMNGLDNKIDKTKNLFISTFIGIVICMFDSMSILKIIFVLKTGNEGVWYSQDIVYYIILVATRLMIFITLYLLDKKQIFNQFIIKSFRDIPIHIPYKFSQTLKYSLKYSIAFLYKACPNALCFS